MAITVGGVKITNGDVEHRADSLAAAQIAQAAQAGTTAEAPAKDSAEFAELRREAGAQLRDEAVFTILATRCGKPCNVTTKEVNAQVAGIITQSFNGSRAEFDAAVKEQGMTMKDLQEAFRASLREQKLAQRAIAKVTFTEAQAQTYYTKNIANYRTAAERRVSHILVATEKEAKALRPQLSADNFAEMAKAKSEDPAAKKSGGDLGPVAGSGLFPEMLAVVNKLKPGQISAPVQTQFGWSILMVRQIPATTKSFASVKESIQQEQLRTAQNAAIEKWRSTTVKKVQDSAKYVNEKVRPADAPAPAPTPTATTPAKTTAAPASPAKTTTAPAPPATTTAAPASPAKTTTAPASPTATTPATTTAAP